ncbi:MAG: glutamyl-tRNA(Gln) amidotransferase, subunit [Gemmatimonadetes bacterium]|jgi:aspartyl-tRNA(Asn)/glutamyl-tRNA(Gln) amidotransferase subunit A|nr:glutamyl-tRNA(Gln) amidotransferase, subunit [Gemmatimonadota bacterium]
MTAGERPRSAADVRKEVRNGARDTQATVEQALQRAFDVKAGMDGLNIFVSLDDALLREHARGAATQLADTEPGSLLGVPVAIKDNIASLHHPTTCGSRMLKGYISPYEATVVARLRAAGAVPFGKTNMDEFAMGSSTENSAYGPTLNPHQTDRTPGGSSGGSAAAVAAGIVPIALGSETGGSVRQPAAFCGVVGVKPTYGRVSRFGLVAFASSLDQVGVFGATVDDAARGLRVIAGHDPLDSTSADIPVPDYTLAGTHSVKGMVIGRPKEYFPESLDPRVRARCDAALAHLAALGAIVKDVSLPHTDLAVPVYYIVAPAEASSNLARFDGVRYGRRLPGDGLRGMYEATRTGGFGPEVTRRILLGTYVLSAGYYDAYYRKAQRVRTLIADDFGSVFGSGVDLLFTPTTPTPAFRLGAISDPYEMYMSDIFTVTANLAGVPAMSQPIGRVDGLPVGGQLIAPHFEEDRMFAAAYALERALGDEAHR